MHGTFRMGDNSRTSVCDSYGQVWEIENLFLGGNGILPRATASNPTLTCVAIALRSRRLSDRQGLLEALIGRPSRP